MFVTQYIKSAGNTTSELFEAMNPGMMQGQAGMMPQDAPSSAPTGLVEFEDIKKQILFGKLKDIKLKLELAALDKQDPQVLNMFEFIDLVILFYNTFTYDQIQTLINNILEMTSRVLNIKIEPFDPNAAPAVDPDKMAQMQQAQQDAEIQQQQSAAQHATAMSQAQVQVAQNTAMADPGFIKKSMEKETAKPSAKATSKTSKKVVPRKKGVA